MMMVRRYIRKKLQRRAPLQAIDPEDIFVDSENVGGFDKDQFEGRMESPLSKLAIIAVVIVFCLLGSGYLFKVWELQVSHGATYAERSENNRLQHSLVFAERGVIYDRNGEPLAWNVPREEDADFSKRQYITTEGFGNLLGYIKYPKKDSSGFYYEDTFTAYGGAEEAYNERLSGKNGIKIIETNALQEVVGDNTIEQPVAGDDIYLTIDHELQEELYASIKEIAEQVGFTGGAGAVIDVTTGELYAVTSYPEYDPNVLTDGQNVETISAWLSDPAQRFLNRATNGLYTPGSIMKPYVALGGLNEGVVTPYTTVLSEGEMAVPNPYDPDHPTYFSDWKAHGVVDVFKALAMSSNIYFYQVGGGYTPTGQEGIGITKLEEYYRMFGFGSEINDPLLGGQTGTIPNPKWKEDVFDGEPWRLGDTYFTAIGQYGVQVTPMQVVRALAALANGGKLLQPTVLTDDAVYVTRYIDDINEAHFETVRAGMRKGVLEGTAKGLNIPETAVAAKTGTAELGVSKARVNSWVTGFWPYEKPKYAFAIVMEQGSRTNLIGGVAVMRHVLDWMRVYAPHYVE